MRASPGRVAALAVVLAGCPKAPGHAGTDATGIAGARTDASDVRGSGGETGSITGNQPDTRPPDTRPPDTRTETRPAVFVEEVKTWWAKPNRKLDVLFMVDNSSAMETAQATLRTGLPSFVNVLKAMPDGLPDLHVGVVTSDMGVDNSDISGCNATGGDKGILKPGAPSACPALTAGARFLTSTGGANPQNNFTGDITAALQCMVMVGATGCGFERPLDAMARALGADGLPAPAENQGFLRLDALLAIVLVTNEDDCSSRQAGFYDVASNLTLASVLGPPGNFRCSEFGHICNGGPPPRRAPNGQVTDTVNLDGCRSAENEGRLVPVADYAAGITALKANPLGEIFVASIHGPVTPYQTHWKPAAATDTGPWPEITHSCMASNGGFADPGVRIQQFARSFGNNSATNSICDTDYGPSLQATSRRLSQLFGRGCFSLPFVDEDGDTGNGIQGDCTVVDRVPTGTGGADNRLVPACADVANVPPCWRLIPASAAPAACPAGSGQVVIERGTTIVTDNTVIEARCALCAPGISDPDHGCP